MAFPARATNVLPDNARLVYSLNLLKNKRAFWLLQIPAVLGFFFFGFLFLWWTTWLRPGLIQTFSAGVEIRLLDLFVLVISLVVFLALHELVHGAFFWIYSRSWPKFGLRSGYAYAAAPGWYFPRRQYLVIALAPFVLLTILGMILLAVVPVGMLAAILFGMVTNAAGAVGDIWIAFMIIKERRTIVIEDLGDGFHFYSLT
jgi:Putative zincin peptidase